jgi:hypothetical protein
MIKDNVQAIPSRIWDWGLRNCSGTPRSFSEEVVRMAVFPTGNATVTEKGIKFNGVYYSSDRAIRETWFEKARSKKRWSVKVSYDPCDMANLYIWNQDDKKYDSCYLLDWNQKYAGKYLDEIIYERQKEDIVKKQLKFSETEAKINLNAEIDAIVANAKNMAADYSGKSKKERVANIKENRRRERELMQSANAESNGQVIVQAKSPHIPAQSSVDDDIPPILRMIKEKAEEKLKND